jgi:radical SAM peptide maturase (CXXX-repeat target family)
MKKFEQWQDYIGRLFPEYAQNASVKDKVLSQSVTFQVTDDCNLACTYCYQIHKGKRRMSFETAKKYIDLIISGEKGFSNYINPEKSPGIIIEFIGGEPFLEIDLIDQICTYFSNKLIEEQHPWATKYCFSICSNGVLYFDEKVQSFLRKWKDHISFSITIDGNKELHDSCRVFPDGKPSYDLAVTAAKDWMSKGYQMGSKITIAPDNVVYFYDAIKHMVELGYEEINANCVYEKGWEPKHATILYSEMKRVADYFLENNLDFERTYFCSIFSENLFTPKSESDLENWCGGNGVMLSCDPDGVLYPCIRYMESSLGDDQVPYSIGNVDIGIAQTECDKCRVDCLKKIDRKTQSTEECFNCPIAEGCSWCTAYNYQVFGTPDARATYICIMHKARALGNAYFWNKYYRQHNMNKRMKIYVPDEWALDIINEDELNMLKELAKEDFNNEADIEG